MNKPDIVLVIEEYYGITLSKSSSFFQKRSYNLNEKNEIEYLNLSKCEISEISILEKIISLTKLDLSENKISDVSILKKCELLTHVNLEKNEIIDISGLRDLILLTDLNLCKNRISDISFLEDLTLLTNLGLANNEILDISILKNLRLLENLDLGHNQFSDISVLEKLEFLSILNLENNKKLLDISILRKSSLLQSLTLRNNPQIVDFSNLKYLLSLTNLILWGNKISDISFLENLKSLTFLSLWNNQISDISFLENLSLITNLDLGGNQISDISFLENLSLINTLDLGGNNISDFSILGNLKSLTSLSIYSNKTPFDTTPLGNLTSLTFLSLDNNKISDISFLKKILSLRYLGLSNNNLNDVSILNYLQNLNNLNLSGNQISDISFLQNLTNIKVLNLSNNNISNLNSLHKLKNISKIHLEGNKIIDIDQFKFIIDTTLYIDAQDNPCFEGYEMKFELNKSHYDLILNLLKKIDEEKREYVLPAKVLLLGNTGCGKSTLLSYILQDESPRVFENNLASTHIIQVEIFPKKIKRNDIPAAVFYDFGGQDYYHGLYKAFLSNDSLNILIWNSKNDKNQIRKDRNGQFTRDYDRNYWLYQLKFQYANPNKEKVNEKSEPILLVQSHADDNFYNRETYNDNYNNFNIVNEFHLAFNSDAIKMNRTLDINLHYFEETLEEQIKQKQIIKYEPTWYRSFLSFILKSKRKTYVQLSDLIPHYKRESDKNNYLLPEVLREIAQTGLILYYKDDDDLKDIVWLNPSGVIENVHKKILSQKIIKENKGIINQKIFDKLVKDDKIIKLLINQRVIFLDEFENNYIIPGYLPLTEEEDKLYELLTFDFIEPNFVLKFEYFIPFGLINQLVCFYGKRKNKKHYWRDQLLFTKDNCKILIKLDFTNLEISVSIKSKDDNRKLDKLQKEIFKDIVDIYWDKVRPEVKHKDIRESNIKIEDINIENLIEGNLNASISHEDIIDVNLINVKAKASLYLEDFNYPFVSPDDLYVSIDNKYFVHHKELQDENKIFNKIKSFGLEIKKETQNDKEIEIRKINKNLVFEKNAGLFRNFTNNKNTENMKKIFISYSKFDDDYRKEFVKHLVTLRDEGLIEDFNCEEIDLGDNSHNVIQKELSECDYMIALVSIDFLNTDYIRKFEVEKAKELGKKIIPIIIKPCDWENSVVKDFHASLRGTNISLDKELFLKDKFKETSEIERHAWWTKVIKELRLKIFTKVTV